MAKVIGFGLASCQGKLNEIEDDPAPCLAGRGITLSTATQVLVGPQDTARALIDSSTKLEKHVGKAKRLAVYPDALPALRPHIFNAVCIPAE